MPLFWYLSPGEGDKLLIGIDAHIVYIPVCALLLKLCGHELVIIPVLCIELAGKARQFLLADGAQILALLGAVVKQPLQRLAVGHSAVNIILLTIEAV